MSPVTASRGGLSAIVAGLRSTPRIDVSSAGGEPVKCLGRREKPRSSAREQARFCRPEFVVFPVARGVAVLARHNAVASTRPPRTHLTMNPKHTVADASPHAPNTAAVHKRQR